MEGGATCLETRDQVYMFIALLLLQHSILIAGYWISHRAIKCVYDAEDSLASLSHDHTAVKSLVYEHFKVSLLLYSTSVQH